MERTAIIVFNYDEKVGKIKKHEAERYFMDARSKVVNFINPRLEEWNKEFNDKEYSDMVFADDETREYYEERNLPKYNKFIQEKMEDIIGTFNDILDYPVKLHADKECDIIGQFMYKKKLVTMKMDLVETTDVRGKVILI